MPATFPAIFADRLRVEGVTLSPEYDLFYDRRRVKSETELAGMRRAQRAAEGGMDAARDLLRRALQNGAGLEVDGEPLDERARQGGDRRGLHEARDDLRRVHRLARRAGGRRPRHGVGADRRGRAGRDRPLAARHRDAVLRRHDADVRRRRAGRGHRPLPHALQGGARPVFGRDPRGRPGGGRLPARLRALPGGRPADAALEGRRARCSRTASTTGSATGSGSRCTRRRRSGGRRGRWSPATSSPSSRGSTSTGTAACGSRISSSSPRAAPRTSRTIRTTSAP